MVAPLLFLAWAAPLPAMECISGKEAAVISPAGADQPSDVAIAENGDLYLVDGVNHRVLIMDPSGKLRFAFGAPGSGPGQFRYPLGIDISGKGLVFIADTGNHRIQVFDLDGTFQYLFPVRSAPGEDPPDPVDVLALDLNGYLYISDNDNHKIKVHKQDGAFVFAWGGAGEVRGRFLYPAMIAANEFNQVFVVDVLNTRVQKFDPDGNFLDTIGTWGVAPGRLFKPKGVAVDRQDRVFVSDSYMGCVQVFSSLGGFRGVLCENGGKKPFVTPTGLCFDAKGRLHVVEMRANRIRIVEPSP